MSRTIRDTTGRYAGSYGRSPWPFTLGALVVLGVIGAPVALAGLLVTAAAAVTVARQAGRFISDHPVAIGAGVTLGLAWIGLASPAALAAGLVVGLLCRWPHPRQSAAGYVDEQRASVARVRNRYRRRYRRRRRQLNRYRDKAHQIVNGVRDRMGGGEP